MFESFENDSDFSNNSGKSMFKNLKPSSSDLMELELKPGKNDIMYVIESSMYGQ